MQGRKGKDASRRLLPEPVENARRARAVRGRLKRMASEDAGPFTPARAASVVRVP